MGTPLSVDQDYLHHFRVNNFGVWSTGSQGAHLTSPPPTLRVFPSFILMMIFGLFYSEDRETLSRNVSRNRFKLSVHTFLTPSQTQGK